MIQASPSLSTLKLEIRISGCIKPNYLDLDDFFATLGTTFPKLRHFEHLAASDLDLGLVGDPTRGPSAVRTFFLQHPDIETLALDWSPKFSLTNREAVAIHSLFPALRHFSGPKWICSVLVRSPIRMRLESLNVLPSRGITSHSYTAVVDSIIELPQLRHLSFPAEDIYEDPGSRWGSYLGEPSLEKYLRSAPELVSLWIRSSGSLKEFNESVQAAFDFAPNLRQLKLDLPEKYTKYSSCLRWEDKSNIDAREMCGLASRLARSCPQLERITSGGFYPEFDLVHRLERNHDGLLEKMTISAGRVHHTLAAR